MIKSLFRSLFSFFAVLPAAALAQEEARTGIAKPWQLNLQLPATPVMEQLYNLHHWLLILITGITIFVFILLAVIIIRFNRRANPVARKFSHNTLLEIVWTVIPIMILVAIAIPSLRLHYFMQRDSDPELTVKVTGRQWYWSYGYPDNGGFEFDSYMKKAADLKEGEPRLLAVDNSLVVPVDTKVRVQITGADVIHSWSVPAFGVKKDAVPGKLNETWFQATETGMFYGQCSQLCGVQHGFMPVSVNVVSKEEFAAWVAEKQKAAGIAQPEKVAKK